jgi:hypothetical protein
MECVRFEIPGFHADFDGRQERKGPSGRDSLLRKCLHRDADGERVKAAPFAIFGVVSIKGKDCMGIHEQNKIDETNQSALLQNIDEFSRLVLFPNAESRYRALFKCTICV